jgi:hypothetical protein
LFGFIYTKKFTEVDGYPIHAKMNYDFFRNTGRQNAKKFRNNL